MTRRIEERQSDASDATLEILRRQQGYDLGQINWHHVEAGDGLAAVVARARPKIGI